jgi:hypothetical protein
MGDPFQIYGPFGVSKSNIAGKEYQKTFWAELDDAYPRISAANGLYVLSVRNGSNFRPQYVGITKRGFTKEVFNANNLVKILNDFAKEKGELCLHLLAKPNDANTGFYAVTLKVLLWTEMFILLLCRKKNPDIANIMGMPFLDDVGIANITEAATSKAANVRTFGNVLGMKKFGMAKIKTKQPSKSKTPPTIQPTIQPNTPPATQLQIQPNGTK